MAATTTTKKARSDPIPHDFVPFMNNNESFWTDTSEWRNIIAFAFSKLQSYPEEVLVGLNRLVQEYSSDTAGQRTKPPIGMDIALIVLANFPELMRVAWGPTLQIVEGGVKHKMLGIALNTQSNWSNPLPFFLGMTREGYAPLHFRRGFSHGTNLSKPHKNFNATGELDYGRYLRTPGVKVDLLKRTLTACYRRWTPQQVPEKCKAASSREERDEIMRDGMLTMFEMLMDMHCRRQAALSNVSVAQSGGSADSIFYPLAEQKSVGGAMMSKDNEWQLNGNGYLTVEVFLPRCSNPPNEKTIQVISAGFKKVVGPVSPYNKDMILMDEAHSNMVNQQLHGLADAECPDYMNIPLEQIVASSTSAAGGGYKKAGAKTARPFCTRFSKVISWDPANPKIAPVVEPVADLRPYTNLGDDWVVPAFVNVEGPYQLSTSKYGWQPKLKAIEVLLMDPILMPVKSAEQRQAEWEVGFAKPSVIPNADDAYAAFNGLLLEAPPVAVTQQQTDVVRSSSGIVTLETEQQTDVTIASSNNTKKRPRMEVADSSIYDDLDLETGDYEEAVSVDIGLPAKKALSCDNVAAMSTE